MRPREGSLFSLFLLRAVLHYFFLPFARVFTDFLFDESHTQVDCGLGYRTIICLYEALPDVPVCHWRTRRWKTYCVKTDICDTRNLAVAYYT